MANACPPPGLLPRLQDFESLWYLSNQIGDGGQGEIYQTFPKPSNKHYEYQQLSDPKQSPFVTKIIQLMDHQSFLQHIVKCYLFVEKHKLLNIYGIYQDRRHKQILIVMQRLSHELHPKYLIDSPTHLRFSRPGYIYVHHDTSIRGFIKQIALQLNTIHNHNRIHFDLKPSNIMFNAITNQWCIIDYDLTKKLKSNNIRNTVHSVYNTIPIEHYRGTQSWTSPEMSTRSTASKPSIISNKTDVFSFGLVVIYVIECGFQPYLLGDQDIQNVHCKQLVSSQKWRRDKVYFDKVLRNGNGDEYIQHYVDEMRADYVISDGLCHLLKNMLLFDVEKRFDVQQILNHSWLNAHS